MLSFDFYTYCCGCQACVNICPVEAIKVTQGKDGFLYPLFENEKCINCGLCENVCPHINAKKDINTDAKNVSTWKYSSTDNDAKKRSSSGAAFFEIAKGAVLRGDTVCGCAWDENMMAKHIVGNKLSDIIRMQGSKYVQSDIGLVYKEVIAQIKDDKQVVFSGTPCQATAIHHIVANMNNGKYRDKLITVAVICHGVASPSAWESFKSWTEEKNRAKLIGVNFRDKTKAGYKKSYCRYDFDSGKTVYTPTYLPTSKYIEATLVYNLAIRESCTHCDCKGINECCDIVIGDWYEDYKGDGSLGTSCLITFSERGKNLVEQSLSNLKHIEWSDVINKNPMIVESTKRNDNKDRFIDEIGNTELWDTVEQLYPKKYKYKKILIKTGLYDLLKKLL